MQLLLGSVSRSVTAFARGQQGALALEGHGRLLNAQRLPGTPALGAMAAAAGLQECQKWIRSKL